MGVVGVGHLWIKWVEHLKARCERQLQLSEVLIILVDMLKNTGLNGIFLSNHCMTTGFGPY